MVKQSIHRSRHRPQVSYRDIPPNGNFSHPRQERVSSNESWLELEQLQELFEWNSHIGQHGQRETKYIPAVNTLRRHDVWDGGEAEVWRLGHGADQAQLFLRHCKGYMDAIGALRRRHFAKVEHWVDVATPGIRYRRRRLRLINCRIHGFHFLTNFKASQSCTPVLQYHGICTFIMSLQIKEDGKLMQQVESQVNFQYHL